MICFFIIGYSATSVLIATNIHIAGLVLIGIIYCAGASFVYYIITNSKLTITELIKAGRDRNKTIEQWENSEKRYSRLFQNSGDILFILNNNYEFITVNNSIRKILGHTPEEVKGKKILELIFNFEETNSIDRDVISNNLLELETSKKPVLFKTGFKHKYSPEPVYLQVRLEIFNFDTYFEVIGKASEIVEDILVDAFQQEHQKYIIGNQLSMAEHMSQRICRNLTKYISEVESNKMRICVREIIINAIEHGNLNIKFEEKTEAILKDNYFNFVQQRSREDTYKNKKIFIEYTLTKNYIEIIIEDSGNGFDHKNFTNDDTHHDPMLAHGRGIMLTLKQFNSVTYNDKGNKVTLIKKW